MEKGDFFFVLKFFVVLSLPVNTDQDHFMLNLISVVSNEVSILLCVFLIHTVAERKYQWRVQVSRQSDKSTQHNFICRYYSKPGHRFSAGLVNLCQNQYCTPVSSIWMYYLCCIFFPLSLITRVYAGAHTHIHAQTCLPLKISTVPNTFDYKGKKKTCTPFLDQWLTQS